MLASADVDGDNKINYEEFLKVMVKYNFVSYDVYSPDTHPLYFLCSVDSLQGQRKVPILKEYKKLK